MKTKARYRKRNTLRWPKQGKYNRVERALPFPSRGEKGCKWRKVVTAGGRVMLEPVA